MKKLLSITLMLFLVVGLSAQNKKEKNPIDYSISGFINLNAIMDFQGLSRYDDFTTSEIPINPTPYEQTMHFHMTARQSRLNFNMNYNTSEGPIKAMISGDFYSGNTGEYSFYRLREAYIEYKNLLLGQTNTTFGNPDVVPNTIDFEGPNSAPTLRNPMIRYKNNFNKSWSYILALEMRGTDITVLDSAAHPMSTLPTLVGNINKEGDWGVITVSGMTAVFRFFDDDNQDRVYLGYGGAFSALFNVGKRNTIGLFAVGGAGVANFISDLSGSGYNGIIYSQPEEFDMLPTYGGFISYTRYWSDQWNSNFVYSFVDLPKNPQIPATDFHFSNYALGNLFYNPNDHIEFGVEYIWGNLHIQNEQSGSAQRLQFLAQFNF